MNTHMKDSDKNYSVAVWTFGHLREQRFYKHLTSAQKFGRKATQNELRVVGDGITGSYVKSEYCGNRDHGFMGKLARAE